MWSEFPDDVHALTLQNQWMVGAALLVVPVTDPGKTSVLAYLPPGSKWYHLDSLKEEVACNGKGEDGGRVNLAAPLEHIPVLIRGGNIVPRKMRLRRSSKLMFYDPYTLVVAPDAAGEAFGNLYLDDEISLAHETRKVYALRRFTFRNNVLTCDGTGVYEATNTVERIVISGITNIPKRVILREASQADMAAIDLVFFYDDASRVVTVKKPDVRVDQSWTISLEV
jgi:alpha 1,3-glucosidase